MPLDAFVVGPDGADLVDRAGLWAQLYEGGAEGAVLIRPDGHVAWRTTTAPVADELVDALASVLQRA